MKKVERRRENKIRGNKVCWHLLKGKWLHYYEIYQNSKMTPLVWSGGSSS